MLAIQAFHLPYPCIHTSAVTHAHQTHGDKEIGAWLLVLWEAVWVFPVEKPLNSSLFYPHNAVF